MKQRVLPLAVRLRRQLINHAAAAERRAPVDGGAVKISGTVDCYPSARLVAQPVWREVVQDHFCPNSARCRRGANQLVDDAAAPSAACVSRPVKIPMAVDCQLPYARERAVVGRLTEAMQDVLSPSWTLGPCAYWSLELVYRTATVIAPTAATIQGSAVEVPSCVHDGPGFRPQPVTVQAGENVEHFLDPAVWAGRELKGGIPGPV